MSKVNLNKPVAVTLKLAQKFGNTRYTPRRYMEGDDEFDDVLQGVKRNQALLGAGHATIEYAKEPEQEKEKGAVTK